MDAIQILEKDHKGAKEILEEISKKIGPEKKKLFETLKHELEMHNSIEENIFYPAVQANPKAAGFSVKDNEAHEVVEAALIQLEELSVEDPGWTPLFMSMQDSLLKHVADEEGRMFVAIRNILTAQQLSELGRRMETEKELLLHPV
jgi:hypothetical protein